MNFLSHMGASDPYPQIIPSQPSPRPQRRHTVTEHSNYRPLFLGGYSTSQRSGLNEIVLNEFSKGGGKYGHSRNPSTTTAAERISCYSNSKRGVVTETNNNHHEAQQPLLTTRTLLHVDDQDIGSSYCKSCIEQLPENHDCMDEGCERVVINVSGLRFETQLRTLDRLPNTLLGDPEARAKFWDPIRQEYFFDRHRPTFQAVLYYYQSGGRLKRPLEVPMDIFLNEVHFYRLGGHIIDNFKRNEGYIIDEQDVVLPEKEWKRKIWEVVEYPESSRLSKIFACVSISFIVASVITFCVETLPQFKDGDCKNVTVRVDANSTTTVSVNNWVEPLFIAESCCITFFVFELVIRFCACPSKWAFLKESINWIDFIAITPYFVFLSIKFTADACGGSHKSSVLSILRVIRVGRIFKLSKHSEGLKILGKTMKTSIRELSMFILFMGIATVIFSGAIFYAELGQAGCMFTSIPEAFWWAIVTMTTVGYGDYYPIGVLGKMIGSFCVLSGVLAIALPVPVIVANFNNYYRHYTGIFKDALAWAWIHREKDISLVEQFLDIESKYVKHSVVPPPPKPIRYSSDLPDFQLPDFIRKSSIVSLFSRYSRKSSSPGDRENDTSEGSNNTRYHKVKFKKRESVRSCSSRSGRRNSNVDPDEISIRSASVSLPPTTEGDLDDGYVFKRPIFKRRGSVYSIVSRVSMKSSLQELSNQNKSEVGDPSPRAVNHYDEIDKTPSINSKCNQQESMHTEMSQTFTKSKSSSFEVEEVSTQTMSQVGLPCPGGSTNFNDDTEHNQRLLKLKKKGFAQSSTHPPANRKCAHDFKEMDPLAIAPHQELGASNHVNSATTGKKPRRRKFKHKRRDSVRALMSRTQMHNSTANVP